MNIYNVFFVAGCVALIVYLTVLGHKKKKIKHEIELIQRILNNYEAAIEWEEDNRLLAQSNMDWHQMHAHEAMLKHIRERMNGRRIRLAYLKEQLEA